ncbi:serine hydrolase domain-containing protein [Flectobacillus roseus]|uniref:Serine hydrolase domain-containing protein n=1 Tax=Flectobacillus roseus TaxID=502259 RepID=A0ABT6Y728_9BACT|nr:serine hydrolase domain-containing protein [Flectobacillus roseus]MDI9859373.1 serine hydrolase domain-containing protein [Flectobacillus roseus]
MRKFTQTFLLVASLTSTGQAQIALTSKQIKRLDSIACQDVPKNAPGIATAIIQNGKVIYKKYAGFADLADSTIINKSSRFNIASNGKQFTALAILTLIDKKKLKLSDDIRKWFPKIYPDIKDKITIQSLLNHTSGVRDCYDLWSLQGYTWWEKSFSNNDVLALIEKQSDLNFKPDTKYLYSNTNYILLALILEKVTKRTFVDYTNEMFYQLNMPNTSFESNYKSIRGQIARAYFNFGTWTTFNWIWNVVGDGNLFTTLEDQIQWEKLALGRGSSGFKSKIISQSQKIIEGSKFTNYGYGLEFGKYKELSYRFHEGATGAWKATTIRFPQNNISIVTLTNTGKSIPYNQTRQMADVIFNLKSDETYLVTQPMSIGTYIREDEILGTYLTESDFAFTFEKINNKIFLKRVGRNDVELEREANNIFHQKFDPAFKQEFTVNSKGELQVTAYYINHSPYRLTKANRIKENFDFRSINGDYINSETNTTLKIEYLEGMNYEITFRNDYKTKGLLVSTNKMLVDIYSLEIQKGKLFLNGARIKNVKYVQK